MVLVNAPLPEPSVVLEFAVVGLIAVLQQTPLTVTALPSAFAVMVPPDVAPVEPIPEIDVVVIMAYPMSADVVKLTWLPYPVPAAFVA